MTVTFWRSSARVSSPGRVGVLRRTGLALAVVTLPGCALFANRGATADLQLSATVASQRARIAESSVAELEQRLRQMEDVLREQGLGHSSGLESMDALRAEVARLRGQEEVLEAQIAGLRADLDAVQLDQERRMLHAEARLRQLEGLLKVDPPPAPRLDVGAGQDDDSASDRGEGEDDVVASSPDEPGEPVAAALTVAERIKLAEEHMRDGRQAAARAVLDLAMQDAKTDAQRAEIQYRSAESLYNEEDWRAAARQFQAVTEAYPKSAWAAPAMLRIGECFEGLGRGDAARTFYEGVVRNHPGTDAAKEAKRKLAR